MKLDHLHALQTYNSHLQCVSVCVMWHRYHFQGPCGTTLPQALAQHESEVF